MTYQQASSLLTSDQMDKVVEEAFSGGDQEPFRIENIGKVNNQTQVAIRYVGTGNRRVIVV